MWLDFDCEQGWPVVAVRLNREMLYYYMFMTAHEIIGVRITVASKEILEELCRMRGIVQ